MAKTNAVTTSPWQFAQPGILQSLPRVGRYLFFSVAQVDEVPGCLDLLASSVDGETVVAALGLQCLKALGEQALLAVPALHEFKPLIGAKPGVRVPSTPSALCCWLRGDDQGDLFHLTQHLENLLSPGFRLDSVVDAFTHGKGPHGLGRDLTGYEDGIENPKRNAAHDAALMSQCGVGLDGSSCVVVQQWVHDFQAFDAMPARQQDHIMGRRRADSVELDAAPESAHVKRTAQESFQPEAFVLRRSMPWAQGSKAGLMFVAFGHSFNAFEAQMQRMVGLEDGIVDGLFQISRPITGANFWCPPMYKGQLDLRAIY